MKALMDDGSELGKEARVKHAKWNFFLLTLGFENSYMNDFVMKLITLMWRGNRNWEN